MRTPSRVAVGTTLTLIAGLLSVVNSPTALAARQRTEVIKADFGVSEPLTALANRPQPTEPFSVEIPERDGAPVPDSGFTGDVSGVQNADAPTIAAIPPATSFDGLSGTAKPPDPVGDVGPNHYVEMVNTRVGIYTKAGANLLNVTIGSIFTGLPGTHNCEGNHGDPIVLHDQLANRWLLTQFTASSPYFLCVAVSQTANPTGAYWLYAFSTGTNFPDYPKFGVWSGGYLASTKEFANGTSFAGVGTYALERSQMLVGGAAKALKVLLTTAGGAWQPGDGLLPADLDGTTLPPNANLSYFIGTMDNGAGTGAPMDGVNVFWFRWNFATNAVSLTLRSSLAISAIDTIYPCSPGSRDCLEQMGTTQKLDILSYRQRPMHRAAYRNFGTHESIVTNQSAEFVFSGTSRAGLRWYELRGLGTTPTLAQQGSYAASSAAAVHRWMGSMAQDRAGNMAIGYSISSATMFPGIRYTGRLATDPLNTLPQGEGVIINGTGAQTGSARWGDYTSMNIDPVDDCTYWYVNQYYAATGGTWRTRIGHFRFPTC
ncbi:hypothetical protein [Allorhizocola rhizosphaerae]|uniref:hypothetical protein n=1 Tax=Allorhizocola rhizosphaerae TaxID=1872709 RepID=UPI000E3B6655|nr:hypothetical protein [Allorhizocola rhizosphaerae]